jgi:hypothetical protein
MGVYPYMVSSKYIWLVSTYRPPELGSAEIDILYLFADGKSHSAYDILKVLKKRAKDEGKETSPGYKDAHKRVKRLVELELISQIEEHFERGAKHYRITPYGLITGLAEVISVDCRYILYNKDNLVIRSLLDFFEDETIDSFHLLKPFPAVDTEEYLHDCCSITINVCKSLWRRFERYNISDILPPDDIIQRYMPHLDNRPVEQHVLDEIKEYEKRLNNRLTNGESEDKVLITALDEYNGRFPEGFPEERIPPFPLLDIYEELQYLSSILEQKKTFFALSIVTEIGRLKEGHPAEKDLETDRDLCLDYILQDKRFIELVSALKHSFDTGYKQFSEKSHNF